MYCGSMQQNVQVLSWCLQVKDQAGCFRATVVHGAASWQFTSHKKRHTDTEVVGIDESETKRQIFLVSLGYFFLVTNEIIS